MRGNSQQGVTYLVLCMSLVTVLACNISTPRGPITPTPEVVNIIATATGSQPTETASAEPTHSSPTSESPSTENGSSPGAEGVASALPGDSDIFADVSIKNGSASFEGEISFPGGDTSDEINIKPIDFDNVTTSGSLIFTLICSGEGNAKVNYRGGAVKDGKPACGETWTVLVVNNSPDSHITIHLDNKGEVNWKLSVKSSQ